jgi:pSer/pThr/pTyr-binding forkhead associated (FHA) protein
MDDATQIIGGTEQYPLDSGTAATSEQCPHCQTDIPAGEMFCPACGYQRGTWAEGGVADTEGTADAGAPSDFVLSSPEGTEYPLPAGETIAGRGAVALKLTDAYASRQHAKFMVDPEAGTVTLTDLGSSNGTFIGEEQLPPGEPRELSPGSEIRLGQTALVLGRADAESGDSADAEATEVAAGEEPADAGNAQQPQAPAGSDSPEEGTPPLAEAAMDIEPAPSAWQLRRDGTDEVIYLNYGATLLGRKPAKADYVIRGDGYVSGLHCELIASEETLELKDRGSTNGTYVNGERAAPDQVLMLSDGDSVRIGSSDFTVEHRSDGTISAAEEPTAAEPDNSGDEPEDSAPEGEDA